MSEYTDKYKEQYGKPENCRGHVWETEDDGDINIFAMSEGHHNGPKCIKCGYSFCHHCSDGPKQDCASGDPQEGR